MRRSSWWLAVGLVCSASFAATAQDTTFARNQASIQGIVVMETPAGMIGQAIDIIATVTPGDKKQTRFERAVGEDMTTSLVEAVRAVQLQHREWDGTQVRMSFEDKYTAKDGGSAGTAYAVALRSLLEGFEIDPGYAMTGDITVDLRVRKIGGVAAKIKGATKDGATIVGIPAENLDAVEDLVVMESPQALLDTQVFALETLDEAVALARTDRNEDLDTAIKQFDALRDLLGPRGIAAIRTPEAEALLVEIVATAPHHTSADLLLRHVYREGPQQLSVTGSLVAILDIGRPAFSIMNNARPGRVSMEDRQRMSEIKRQLSGLRSKVHPDTREFRNAFNAYVSAGTALVKARAVNNKLVQRYNKSIDTLVKSYAALGEDQDVLEAMMRGSY
ncbi:MAG: S16 family serine protease [Planctomycetota bacterium]